jgi:hypothetical protein
MITEKDILEIMQKLNPPEKVSNELKVVENRVLPDDTIVVSSNVFKALRNNHWFKEPEMPNAHRMETD